MLLGATSAIGPSHVSCNRTLSLMLFPIGSASNDVIDLNLHAGDHHSFRATHQGSSLPSLHSIHRMHVFMVSQLLHTGFIVNASGPVVFDYHTVSAAHGIIMQDSS